MKKEIELYKIQHYLVRWNLINHISYGHITFFNVLLFDMSNLVVSGSRIKAIHYNLFCMLNDDDILSIKVSDLMQSR